MTDTKMRVPRTHARPWQTAAKVHRSWSWLEETEDGAGSVTSMVVLRAPYLQDLR